MYVKNSASGIFLIFQFFCLIFFPLNLNFHQVLVTLTEADLLNLPFDIKLGQRIKLVHRLEQFKSEIGNSENNNRVSNFL